MQLFLLLVLLALLFLLFFTIISCAEILGSNNSFDEKPKYIPKSKRVSPTKTSAKRKAPSKVSVKSISKVQKKVKSKNLHTKPLNKTFPTSTITKSKVLENNLPKKINLSKQQVEKKIKLGFKTGDSGFKVEHSSSFGSYARVEPRKTEEYCSEMSSSIPDPDEN